MIRNIILFSIPLFLLGCSKEDDLGKSTLSVSACSKKLTNGKIVDCVIDKSAEDRLTNSFTFFENLDKSHPGPNGPDVLDLKNSESYYVEYIDEGNVLHIENGHKISFAGLQCNNSVDFKRYLNAFFLGEKKHRINYELTGYEERGIKYAYIWEIGSEFDSLSPTNETVISSQWCFPIEQEGHQFHSRYTLISNYAKENAL